MTDRLEAYVGRAEMIDGATVIFFPHTSGNSFWRNSVDNRALLARAIELLRSAAS